MTFLKSRPKKTCVESFGLNPSLENEAQLTHLERSSVVCWGQMTRWRAAARRDSALTQTVTGIDFNQTSSWSWKSPQPPSCGCSTPPAFVPSEPSVCPSGIDTGESVSGLVQIWASRAESFHARETLLMQTRNSWTSGACRGLRVHLCSSHLREWIWPNRSLSAVSSGRSWPEPAGVRSPLAEGAWLRCCYCCWITFHCWSWMSAMFEFTVSNMFSFLFSAADRKSNSPVPTLSH